MSIRFYKLFGTRLYRGKDKTGSVGAGESACYCLALTDTVQEEIELDQKAVKDGKICSTFVFSNSIREFHTAEEANAWIAVLDGLLNQAQVSRAIIWTESAIDGNGAVLAGITPEADYTLTQLRIRLCIGTSLILKSGTHMRLDENTGELRFGMSGDCGLYIEGMKNDVSMGSFRLPLSGKDTGCLRFYLDIWQTRFIQLFHPAMAAAYQTDSDNKAERADKSVSRIAFPFLYTKAGEQNVRIRFDASFFPDDLYNEHCSNENARFAAVCLGGRDFSLSGPGAVNMDFARLYFSRKTYLRYERNLEGGGQTAVNTCYQNIYGDRASAVLLNESAEEGQYASGFVFANGQNDTNIFMAPEGDFRLFFEEGCQGAFLCGVEGSEQLVMEGENAYWRFAWGMPGYSPRFPLKHVSVTGPQSDLNGPFLTKEYLTSWISVVREEMSYISVPKGSYYYGGGKELLPPDLPKLYLEKEGGIFFPMMPCQGTDDGQSFLFERQILMKVRKEQIEKWSDRRGQAGRRSSGKRWISTPSGQLALLNGNTFEEIQLARSIGPDGSYIPLRFRNPDQALTGAFLDAGLLLVAANSRHLSGFDCEAYIGEWKCRIETGAQSRYGDYKNIMIVKGRKGSLYNPNGESLFANPMLWTGKDDFSSPVTEEGSSPDKGQQLILSQWLMDYCRKAEGYGENDEYFGNWNRLVKDPSWQGVLFLNVSLEAGLIPASLQPILEGIDTPDNFCYHHVGFTISPVEQKDGVVSQRDAASFFGLIYYKDNAVVENNVTTVLPGGSGDYEFKLLVLRVLFENSVVKKFESYAQLTINELFGCRVASDIRGCKNNTMLLEGTFQVRDGVSTYLLKNTAEGRFFFSGGVLRYVGMKKSVMEQDGSFSLDGCIAFEEQEKSGKQIDIFSFGGPADSEAKGLEFTTLAVTQGAENGRWRMDYGRLTFNPASSEARQGSLCQEFGLNYKGFLCEEGTKKPEDYGYQKLENPAGLRTLNEKPWFGLQYSILAGSLGELAGKAGIKAELLMAWNIDGEGYLGVILPGSGADFLNLQGVLKISYGKARLVLDRNGSFLLILPDISLKLLNIVSIPPAGTTRFFLFGRKGDGSLGWYAAYKKKEEKKGGTIDEA